MLLRSLTKHVRDQNWFAVFLDFFIVVAGILIAFQITNWNEARVKQQSETSYLLKLIDDLNHDLGEMDIIDKIARERMAAIEMVLDRAGENPLPKSYYISGSCVYEPCTDEIIFETVKPFAAKAPHAANDVLSRVPDFDLSNGTYETLVNTGDISVLRNEKLVNQIQAYYRNALEVQELDRLVWDNYQLFNQARHKVGLSMVGKNLEDVIEATMQNSEFSAALMSYWAISAFQIRSMSHTRNMATELIVVLEEEAR